MVATEIVVPEVPTALPAGTIVRLPDGSLAEVTLSTAAEVEFVLRYLRIAGIPGAGPWTCRRDFVEVATAAERVAYRTAVARASEPARRPVFRSEAADLRTEAAS